LEIIYPANTLLQILYVEDLLRAFIALLEKDQSVGLINLCPEETITLGELAEAIVSICRSKSKIHFQDSSGNAFPIKVISLKAQKVLGWKSRTTIRDILKNYYDFISVPQ
jgi:nucleoside-diphosphate-sugar epimerase